MMTLRRALWLSSAMGTPLSKPMKLRMANTLANITPPQAVGDDEGANVASGWLPPALTIRMIPNSANTSVSMVPRIMLTMAACLTPMYVTMNSVPDMTIANGHQGRSMPTYVRR